MGVDETKKSYIFLQNRSSGILECFCGRCREKRCKEDFLFFIFFERGSIVVLKMFKF